MSMWWQCQPLHCTRMGFKDYVSLLRFIHHYPASHHTGRAASRLLWECYMNTYRPLPASK